MMPVNAGFFNFSAVKDSQRERLLNTDYLIRAEPRHLRIDAKCDGLKRAGRTLTICSADAFAINAGGEMLIATMRATMMNVAERI